MFCQLIRLLGELRLSIQGSDTMFVSDGSFTIPVTRDVATQVRSICARLLCIYGLSTFASGRGCNPITVKANKDRGPHSLECGL